MQTPSTPVGNKIRQFYLEKNSLKASFMLRQDIQDEQRRQQLYIQLINQNRKQVFSKRFNQQYFQQQGQQLNIPAQNPTDFIQQLFDVQKMIDLNQDGLITIKLMIGKFSIVHQIRLERKQLNQYDEMKIYVDKIKKGLQLSNLELKQLLAKQSDLTNFYKQKVQGLQNKLKQQEKMFQNKVESIKSQNQTAITQIHQQMSKINRQIQITVNNKIQQMQNENKKIRRGLSISHPKNPQKGYFATVYNQDTNSTLVTQIHQSGNIFVMNNPIPLNKTTNFKVKIIHNSSSIWMGICSASLFNNMSTSNNQSVTMYANNGYIYQNGGTRAGGASISNGQTVLIQVNLATWMISWHRDNQMLTQTSIANQMKNKQLFFYVWMNFGGSNLYPPVVQIFYD